MPADFEERVIARYGPIPVWDRTAGYFALFPTAVKPLIFINAGEEPETVVYKHSCNLCDYSTNEIDASQRHKISRSHFAKEAEARGGDENDPEAVVVYKHHLPRDGSLRPSAEISYLKDVLRRLHESPDLADQHFNLFHQSGQPIYPPRLP